MLSNTDGIARHNFAYVCQRRNHQKGRQRWKADRDGVGALRRHPGNKSCQREAKINTRGRTKAEHAPNTEGGWLVRQRKQGKRYQEQGNTPPPPPFPFLGLGSSIKTSGINEGKWRKK